MSYYRGSQRLARLRRALTEGGKLCLEPGLAVLAYEHRGRYVYTSEEFKSLGAPVCGDPARALEAAAQVAGFAAIVYAAAVYVASPAARVVDACCRGAVVLCPAPGPRRSRTVLSLDAGEARAAAEVEVSGGVYRARLVYTPSPGSPARGARVEVRARPRGALLAWTSLRILEAGAPGVHEGARDTLPGEPRAIIMPELSGHYAPRVVELLGLERGVVGYEPSVFEYEARLVIDLPLRPDAKTEKQL